MTIVEVTAAAARIAPTERSIPLGEDDEGLPDRDQRDHGGLHRDLEQVADGKEVGRELRQHQPHRQQDAGREDGGAVDDRALRTAKEAPRGRNSGSGGASGGDRPRGALAQRTGPESMQDRRVAQFRRHAHRLGRARPCGEARGRPGMSCGRAGKRYTSCPHVMRQTICASRDGTDTRTDEVGHMQADTIQRLFVAGSHLSGPQRPPALHHPGRLPMPTAFRKTI